MLCYLEISGQSFGGHTGKIEKYPEFRDVSKPWLEMRKSNQRDWSLSIEWLARRRFGVPVLRVTRVAPAVLRRHALQY